MDGKIIHSGLLFDGSNTVQMINVESGIYLFKINESMERIVIE